MRKVASVLVGVLFVWSQAMTSQAAIVATPLDHMPSPQGAPAAVDAAATGMNAAAVGTGTKDIAAPNVQADIDQAAQNGTPQLSAADKPTKSSIARSAVPDQGEIVNGLALNMQQARHDLTAAQKTLLEAGLTQAEDYLNSLKTDARYTESGADNLRDAAGTDLGVTFKAAVDERLARVQAVRQKLEQGNVKAAPMAVFSRFNVMGAQRQVENSADGTVSADVTTLFDGVFDENLAAGLGLSQSDVALNAAQAAVHEEGVESVDGDRAQAMHEQELAVDQAVWGETSQNLTSVIEADKSNQLAAKAGTFGVTAATARTEAGQIQALGENFGSQVTAQIGVGEPVLNSAIDTDNADLQRVAQKAVAEGKYESQATAEAAIAALREQKENGNRTFAESAISPYLTIAPLANATSLSPTVFNQAFFDVVNNTSNGQAHAVFANDLVEINAAGRAILSDTGIGYVANAALSQTLKTIVVVAGENLTEAQMNQVQLQINTLIAAHRTAQTPLKVTVMPFSTDAGSIAARVQQELTTETAQNFAIATSVALENEASLLKNIVHINKQPNQTVLGRDLFLTMARVSLQSDLGRQLNADDLVVSSITLEQNFASELSADKKRLQAFLDEL